MKRAFWILIVGVLSNAEGMNAVDLDSVLSEAQTVFRSICYSEYKLVDGSNESSKPHSVKFSEQRGVEIDLSKHEDRHRLKLIREDDPSRPIDFTVRLTADSQVWRVTAGCRRKSDSGWTLSNPDGLFPYPDGFFNRKTGEWEDKALNYVFGYNKELRLNEHCIPHGGPSYVELLRGFVGYEVHDRCKQVADFLILKPQSIDRIKTMTKHEVKYGDTKGKLEGLICLLMTSEYMRGSQALGIARMGHLSFKWHPEQFNINEYKKKMIYPPEGGSSAIMKCSEVEMINCFRELWKQSPYPEKVKHLDPDVQKVLKEDFLSRQLNKIKMIYADFLDGEYESPSLIAPIPGSFRDVVAFMIRPQSPISPESE